MKGINSVKDMFPRNLVLGHITIVYEIRVPARGPNTLEAEAGGQQIQGHSEVHREFDSEE